MAKKLKKTYKNLFQFTPATKSVATDSKDVYWPTIKWSFGEMCQDQSPDNFERKRGKIISRTKP